MPPPTLAPACAQTRAPVPACLFSAHLASGTAILAPHISPRAPLLLAVGSLLPRTLRVEHQIRPPLHLCPSHANAHWRPRSSVPGSGGELSTSS